MAVNHLPLIKTKDLRVCRFFIRYIRIKIPANDICEFDENSIDSIMSCRLINKYISENIPPENRELFILGMERAYNKTIIQESFFKLLIDDKRATFYLWGKLQFDDKYNARLRKLTNQYNDNWCKQFGLSESPISHMERYNSLIYFFDNICVEIKSSIEVVSFLNDFYIFWRKINPGLINVSWLKVDDEDGCYWAYKYIKAHQESTKPDSNNKLWPVNIPNPLSAEEAYLSFYVMSDLWGSDFSASVELIRRMSKSWGQRIYRKKLSTKKNLLEISDEHKEKLSFLSDFYKKDKTQVIEMLIEERTKGIEVRLAQANNN